MMIALIILQNMRFSRDHRFWQITHGVNSLCGVPYIIPVRNFTKIWCVQTELPIRDGEKVEYSPNVFFLSHTISELGGAAAPSKKGDNHNNY